MSQPPLSEFSEFVPIFSQEPITGSEQLSCTCVTAFSVYFYNGFGANFEYFLNSMNQSAKPRPKNYIFYLLITFGFPF